MWNQKMLVRKFDSWVKLIWIESLKCEETWEKLGHKASFMSETSFYVFCSLRELERPRPPWDQQPECRQIKTQEVHKAPPITWWRAVRVEDKRTWNTRDMQERIGALEIQLKDPHMEVMERKLVALPSCFIAIACMWVSTCPEFGLFTAFCFFFKHDYD